jgi:hypothetical protein
VSDDFVIDEADTPDDFPDVFVGLPLGRFVQALRSGAWRCANPFKSNQTTIERMIDRVQAM